MVLELCAEDDYGSWELWWNTEGHNKDVSTLDLRLQFVSCIEELINEHEIVPKIRGKGSGFLVVPFSKDLLLQQISATQLDPDNDYWFGVPEAQ